MKVYIVHGPQNSITGNGPIVIKRCFDNYEAAVEFMNSQSNRSLWTTQESEVESLPTRQVRIDSGTMRNMLRTCGFNIKEGTEILVMAQDSPNSEPYRIGTYGSKFFIEITKRL